eukprot:Sspe_Gene.44152::Locus_21639_Transcript_2_3_Confidence_0.333_Length_842::g.44152::m.44152
MPNAIPTLRWSSQDRMAGLGRKDPKRPSTERGVRRLGRWGASGGQGLAFCSDPSFNLSPEHGKRKLRTAGSLGHRNPSTPDATRASSTSFLRKWKDFPSTGEGTTAINLHRHRSSSAPHQPNPPVQAAVPQTAADASKELRPPRPTPSSLASTTPARPQSSSGVSTSGVPTQKGTPAARPPRTMSASSLEMDTVKCKKDLLEARRNSMKEEAAPSRDTCYYVQSDGDSSEENKGGPSSDE